MCLNTKHRLRVTNWHWRFEADNDTTTLYATLETADGVPSELEFEIHIISINGTKTRSATKEAT